MLRAVAFGSRLLPTRPVKDFHLQSSAHAGHTKSSQAPPVEIFTARPFFHSGLRPHFKKGLAVVHLGAETGIGISVRLHRNPHPPAQAAADRMLINAYARRLARVTGHPVSTVRSGGNFHIVFASQDDRAWLRRRLSEWLPGTDQRTYKVFDRPPRSIRCLVVAFAGTSNPHVYTRAVALIRSELPDLMRSGCIHEELAQGLGAANDSPHAHPSVFNDDDAFALLTGHDEALLGMLYDPRLEPGISAHQARPLVRKLARERLRQAP